MFPPTLLIPDQVVHERFTMRQCIDAVQAGYLAAGREGVVVSPRSTLPAPGQARLLTLSASSSALGYAMSQAYTGAPIDVDRRTSTVDRRAKVMAAFDLATGACAALVGATTLSWLKTGAMGAVAIAHLAPPGASSLALVGAGRQASAALRGAVEVRDLTDVRVWSRTTETATRFAREHADVADVRPVPSAEHAVEGAAVVITTTTSTTPVVAGRWLSPDSHVNSIGAHYPGHRELDADAVAGARVVVDTREQARLEKGELLLAEQEGRFTFADVEADLGEVVSGTHRFTREGPCRSLFASCGSGIEALAAVVGVLEVFGDDPSLTRITLDG